MRERVFEIDDPDAMFEQLMLCIVMESDETVRDRTAVIAKQIMNCHIPRHPGY